MTMEWTISIEGTNEFGDTIRREVRIDKSDERLRDGDLGLSIDDGKKIMATLQATVVTEEVEAYTLFRRVCPDCQTFRPVKDYTTRRIRTVFGTVEVRNPRWLLCRDCHPGMDAAFAPLKEICPDRATPELMELTARLGSIMPYRQAATMLAQFLPVEPTETRTWARGVLRLWRCDRDFRRRQDPQTVASCNAKTDQAHHRLVPHRHDGKRYRSGLRVATTLAESAVNSLVAKRMVKKQQMRWTQHGAHMLMQVRSLAASARTAACLVANGSNLLLMFGRPL